MVSGTIGYATPDTFHFMVHFVATDPSDPITSLPGSSSPIVGVTGPNGFAGLATWFDPDSRDPQSPVTSDGQGGYWVRYIIHSPQGFFDNGTYTIGVAAGSVRTASGDENAAAGAGQTYIWFPDSVFSTVSGNLSGSQLRISVERWDRGAAAAGTNIRTLFLVRADGRTDELDMTPDQFTTPTRVHIRGTVYFTAPGGTWDFTDNGTYTVLAPTFTSGVRTGSVLAAQYYLWFGPRVDLVSSQLADYSWTVTMRFTGPDGIDLSSIGNQNAYFMFGLSGEVDPLVSRFGTLAGSPTVNSNGSVDATYVYYTGPQGFTAQHSGPARVSVTGVRGSGGDYVYGQTFSGPQISSATPLVIAVDGSDVISTRWSIVVLMGSGYADMTGLWTDDLRIEGPNDTLLSPTSIGLMTGPAGSFRVTFTLAMPSGQELSNGHYQVFLRAGALDILGQASSEVMLGSWWLWF
jgi:hypothetical protein